MRDPHHRSDGNATPLSVTASALVGLSMTLRMPANDPSGNISAAG
jgi:hypothetical protein